MCETTVSIIKEDIKIFINSLRKGFFVLNSYIIILLLVFLDIFLALFSIGHLNFLFGVLLLFILPIITYGLVIDASTVSKVKFSRSLFYIKRYTFRIVIILFLKNIYTVFFFLENKYLSKILNYLMHQHLLWMILDIFLTMVCVGIITLIIYKDMTIDFACKDTFRTLKNHCFTSVFFILLLIIKTILIKIVVSYTPQNFDNTIHILSGYLYWFILISIIQFFIKVNDYKVNGEFAS